MYCYQAFILICTFGNVASNIRENCTEEKSSLSGYGIYVTTQGMPSRDNGTVVIKSVLNKSLVITNQKMCVWTYDVQGKVNIFDCQKVYLVGSSISWIFSESGLKKIAVTVMFEHLGKHKRITNCTFVNVTDCHVDLSVKVSTATGQFNITQEHSVVTANSPGFFNFTASTIKIDPYYICKHFYFAWELGDSHNASGHHVNHYYYKSGVYVVVLNVYKVISDDEIERKFKFVKNLTFKVHIKECHVGLKVKVLTSTGSYNISQNHTKVTTNFPGFVNVTVSTFKIAPHSLCKHLHFAWELGDGHNVSGKHIHHYYNNTGLYDVVLSVFKVVRDDEIERHLKFVKYLTFKVNVKEKYVPTKENNTAVDLSLVLGMFFICFIFVVCLVVFCFRKRLHRHTEVATFDFRHAELQSSFDGPCRPNPKHGCLNAVRCRRDSNEHLLNFENYPRYSSNGLHEEL